MLTWRQKQTKKNRKRKGKNNSKVDISDSNAHRSEHDMIHIPHEASSSDQKLNSNEYDEFDVELDSIRDQSYNGIKFYQ